MARDDKRSAPEELPFGAIERPDSTAVREERRRRPRRGRSGRGARDDDGARDETGRAERPRDDAPRRDDGGGERAQGGAPENGKAPHDGEGGAATDDRPREGRRKRWQKRRRRRRGGGGGGQGEGGAPRATQQGSGQPPPPQQQQKQRQQRPQQGGGPRPGGEVQSVTGMLVLERANHGRLRRMENQLLPGKHDVHVPPRLVQKLALREGSMIRGVYGRGHGKNKYDLLEVHEVDGRDPDEAKDTPSFKRLTSIDPDFHYALGDGTGDTSMRIVDLICPVGRGQRGLIVAPPRSGKTILLQKFAKGLEKVYPEVKLVVLLVDERPEEATEWRRTVENGEVYVSTNDELHKNHVELAEMVWKRCTRLVELGEDVVVLLDSITRLGRAYNNVHGFSGKTMSGGLDTRALERPKQFFGAARNTETAGSLTILGTTLIETGSQMDKVIFEEFKGTGNMELVLSRKLADRRIFPAIDIEKSGTRKEEKLISSSRLRLVNTLRRVLHRMHFAEAMELLITKLDDVEKTDDFLKRFEIDPEA